MKIKQWIKEHRQEIDNIINAELFRYDGNGGPGTIPNPPPKRNDDERYQWVQNYEPLYVWAKSANK